MTHDAVNHPSHYTSHPARCECGKPIECIQITEHHGFNLGNALKYLWRADHKGSPIVDLNKAIWYIEREIFKRQREQEQVGKELVEAVAAVETDYPEPTPAAVRRAGELSRPRYMTSDEAKLESITSHDDRAS